MAARTLQSQAARYATLQGVLAVGALLMVMAVYWIGIRPALKQRGVLLTAMDVQRRDLATGQSRLKDLKQREREVEQLRARLEHKKLPRKPDMDQFMRDITRVSDQSALKKMTVQLGSPKRSDLFSEMPIALTFTGDFASVVSFLKQTEDMQRLTRVRSLSIKSRDPEAGAVEVEVAMNIYFADE